MQVRTVAIALSAALFAAIAARAEEKPNLTGAWRLNLKTSKLSDGKPIPYYTEFIEEIDHKDPKLKIVEKIKTSGGQSDRTVVWDLTTGGKETEADVTGSSAKASATWEGNRLVTRIIGEGWAVVRKYTMAPDGKSITAEWTLTTDSVSTATEVWEKQ
jgi:hypothetical protein